MSPLPCTQPKHFRRCRRPGWDSSLFSMLGVWRFLVCSVSVVLKGPRISSSNKSDSAIKNAKDDHLTGQRRRTSFALFFIKISSDRLTKALFNLWIFNHTKYKPDFFLETLPIIWMHIQLEFSFKAFETNYLSWVWIQS